MSTARSIYACIYIPDIYCQLTALKDKSLYNQPFVLIEQSNRSQRTQIFAANTLAQQKHIYPGYPLSILLKKYPSVKVVHYDPKLLNRLKVRLKELSSHFTPEFNYYHKNSFILNLTGTEHLYKTSLEKYEQHVFNYFQAHLKFSNLRMAFATSQIHSFLLSVSSCTNCLVLYNPEVEKNVIQRIKLQHIPNIHHKNRERLKNYNLQCLGDLLRYSKDFLKKHFQRDGEKLYAFCQGLNLDFKTSQKNSNKEEAHHTFQQDSVDLKTIEGALCSIADQLAYQLRQRRAVSRQYSLTLNYSDDRMVQTKKILPQPSNHCAGLRKMFKDALLQIHKRRIGIRSISIIAHQLTEGIIQADLFSSVGEKELALEKSMDTIRNKIGFHGITTANTMIQSTPK